MFTDSLNSTTIPAREIITVPVVSSEKPFVLTYSLLAEPLSQEWERLVQNYRGYVESGKPVSVVASVALDAYNRPVMDNKYPSAEDAYRRLVNHATFNIVIAPIHVKNQQAFYILFYEPADSYNRSLLDADMKEKFHALWCAEGSGRSPQDIFPPLGEGPERGIRFEGIIYENGEEATMFQPTVEFMPERYGSDEWYEVSRERYKAQQVRFAKNLCLNIIEYLQASQPRRVSTRK
jgi:hypothetical protein